MHAQTLVGKRIVYCDDEAVTATRLDKGAGELVYNQRMLY